MASTSLILLPKSIKKSIDLKAKPQYVAQMTVVLVLMLIFQSSSSPRIDKATQAQVVKSQTKRDNAPPRVNSEPQTDVDTVGQSICSRNLVELGIGFCRHHSFAYCLLDSRHYPTANHRPDECRPALAPDNVGKLCAPESKSARWHSVALLQLEIQKHREIPGVHTSS